MINVKISIPSSENNIDFTNFIGKDREFEMDTNFHINSNVEKADFWFIFENLYQDTEYCTVPKENVIYLNNETSFPKNYFFQPHMKKFISQFHEVHSCYLVPHKNQINTYPFLPWMIHAPNARSIYSPSSLDYSYFLNFEKPKKKNNLSIICSSKSHTENHNIRFEFTNMLKKHFGDELSWYGKGVNEIKYKYDVIANSKYHIVLENDSRKNLFSEKLLDSYLGLSFPIYYGATNIFDYFKSNSLVEININDINYSIKQIEMALNNSFYERNLEFLIESKNKIINDFNFYNRIIDIMSLKLNKQNTFDYIHSLNSSEYFWKKNTSRKLKIKKYFVRKYRLNF